MLQENVVAPAKGIYSSSHSLGGCSESIDCNSSNGSLVDDTVE